jgi:hypothetical protein
LTTAGTQEGRESEQRESPSEAEGRQVERSDLGRGQGNPPNLPPTTFLDRDSLDVPDTGFALLRLVPFTMGVPVG